MHIINHINTIVRRLYLSILIISLSAVLSSCASITSTDANLRLSSLNSAISNSTSIFTVNATSNVSFLLANTATDWFNEAAGWLKGVVLSLLVIGGLYLLGKTGLYFRRGIRIKKNLKKAKTEALLRGLKLNANYYKYKRKSTLYIVLPLLFFMTAYGILYKILPLPQFMGSLLVLIVPIIGFFGILTVPSSDLPDYF